MLRFSDFVFDPATRLLTRNAEPVHLSPRTLRLLEVLINGYPRALSHTELMEAVWANVVVEEDSLNTAVSDLRNALGDPDLIRTVPSGYVFGGVNETVEPVQYELSGDGIRVSFAAAAAIGRHPGCDVWIDSPDVSRHHAKITVHPDRVTIEDLNSRNGTWVRGERLSGPRDLEDGDRIRVGDVSLVFRAQTGNESNVSDNE